MLSIIIPTYNEEKTLQKTIVELKKVLKENNLDKNSEIIVVNDGSTDKTQAVANKNKVTVLNNPSNMGYGFSIKKGIQHAKNEMILIIDADLTYPVSVIPQMIEKKKEGYDLVVGARTGKYYKQSAIKCLLRKLLKVLVEFISEKKIKDINSGLRIFDKSLVIEYFPRLCNTFSFTTSQTLAYLMNNHFVCYVDIPYNKRMGKTKVKLFKDSIKALRYILESCIYYNPLKIFTLLSIGCIFFSIISFIISHFANIHAGYILGIGSLLASLIIFSLGLLAVLLKQIMDKKYEK